MDIHDRLTGIFREVLMDDSIELADGMSSDDIDGWDSFAHLNIILAVENAFNLTISDEEAPELRNIGALVRFITGRLDTDGAGKSI